MRRLCPYFRKNRCVSKHCLKLKLKMSEITICSTEAYIKCLIYIETGRIKKRTEIKDDY